MCCFLFFFCVWSQQRIRDYLAMATTAQKQQRSSQETERRHLLSPSNATTPTPSAATSVVDFSTAEGQTTPRAASPAPIQQLKTHSYRGFPSEAAYLEVLQQWAESKRYLEPDTGLQGFYGQVTMEEYARRPGLKLEGLGLRRRVSGWRESRKREGKTEGR